MSISRILIANRGEIAVRIARSAADLDLATVSVFPADDEASAHVWAATQAAPLPGRGAAAYLDGDALINAALDMGCDALHPGYGFLSEDATFARKCADRGLIFIGPTPEALMLFGDKARSREFAIAQDIPLLPGTTSAVSLEEAKAFFASLGKGAAMMIKAISGGGGRGMRAVHQETDIAEAYQRCRSEASNAFGNDALYVEQLVTRARHIEIQVIGDAAGTVANLWERDCTLQRRNQKLIEIAPSPAISAGLRRRLTDAALKMASAAGYSSLGTFEFLVDAERPDTFAFMEANPRIQVEHTITEAISGVDLVAAQIRIAGGATLGDLNLPATDAGPPPGFAIQFRVNAEKTGRRGDTKPSAGQIARFVPPLGPGVRVDTHGYAGFRLSPAFDSLLAKVIVHHRSPDFARVLSKSRRVLSEFHIDGVDTNLLMLRALLERPEIHEATTYTRFVEDYAAELADAADEMGSRPGVGISSSATTTRVAASQPLEEGAVTSPMAGVLIAIDVAIGDMVREGQQVAILEAMKMEHVMHAPWSGVVREIRAEIGDAVYDESIVLILEALDFAVAEDVVRDEQGPDEIRPDLAEMLARRAAISDEGRPDAVEKRHGSGRRTARENLNALFDGEYSEYGEFLIAAQRSRRSLEELERLSPADGLVTGIGAVNGDQFGQEQARCLALAYDYTVFAGTQGYFNHMKTDRMIELAHRWRLPTILYAEGGGGRPGETDWPTIGGLAVTTFTRFAGLSGLVPMLGIASGRCFAGNAALLGCSDVIIATRDANIGMGGPAMIEGGGLGTFQPEDIGPIGVQTANGVVDLVAEDDLEATVLARKYLSYFQGAVPESGHADQRLMRRLIPENRLRSYDVREIIETFIDSGSMLELRRHFGLGMITALVRIGSAPVGVLANNSRHLGGAIDADAADKAARFMQLCDAFDIPLLSLCDTPGFMVGPQAEKSAQVRKFARMFKVASSLTVPCYSIVLRKAYGLGALAMTFGGAHNPLFTLAWPTGEFGGMGLEGGVKLAYRKELEAIEDAELRNAFYREKVAAAYDAGKAMNAASYFEVDAVIDPLDSRDWILRGLRMAPPATPRTQRKLPYVDSW